MRVEEVRIPASSFSPIDGAEGGRRNPHLLDAHALGPSGSSAAVEGDTGEDGGSGRAPDPCGVA